MVLMRRLTAQMFGLLAGVGDSGILKYEPLLRGAEEAVLNRLKPNVDIAGNMERLCDAAAAIACCSYRKMEAGAGAEELRVGDITVRRVGGAAGGVEALRDEYLGRIADLLEPQGDFAFITAEAAL